MTDPRGSRRARDRPVRRDDSRSVAAGDYTPVPVRILITGDAGFIGSRDVRGQRTCGDTDVPLAP